MRPSRWRDRARCTGRVSAAAYGSDALSAALHFCWRPTPPRQRTTAVTIPSSCCLQVSAKCPGRMCHSVTMRTFPRPWWPTMAGGAELLEYRLPCRSPPLLLPTTTTTTLPVMVSRLSVFAEDAVRLSARSHGPWVAMTSPPGDRDRLDPADRLCCAVQGTAAAAN